MFDTQPKIVFMENFRWSKEALSQQNLQLWDLEPTSAPTPKANVELWDRLWSLFMCRFFLQVTLYSSIQIYTLWSTLKIFSNARENSERESHPGVHIYFPTPTITCKQNSWWLGWSSLNSISRDLQLCSHPKPWGAAIAPLVNMGPENSSSGLEGRISLQSASWVLNVPHVPRPHAQSSAERYPGAACNLWGGRPGGEPGCRTGKRTGTF